MVKDRSDGLDEAGAPFAPGDGGQSGIDDDVRPKMIVAIGASAGGLDALEALFTSMPLDTGAAFIVIQHLSRDFESHMPSLLGRKTEMPVATAENEMVVKPNHIYLIPKGKVLEIVGDRLKLSELDRTIIPPTPITIFFRSLAKHHGRKSIGVVLSGGGSDGSAGAVDIHEAGGKVIAQDPRSAQFESMPQNVINTGIFDLILRPNQIAEAIGDYCRGLVVVAEATPDDKGSSSPNRIMELLKDAYSVDFSVYKPATIVRRIERRIQIDQIASVDAYAERLGSSVEELDKLYEDLLIGVTQFFRDPLQFAYLETKILPELIKLGEAHGEIRVWVAGCASGEEAYSIAMLLDEATHRRDIKIKIRIFATDIHGGSLHRAMTGLYSPEAVVDLSPERLARYFTAVNDGYQISPALKELTLFTRHNLVQDPPFTNMDLVTCRNLLIYLDNEAQEKAIARLHFALRDQGFLFLGSSERNSRYNDEFEMVSPQVQIFKKKRDVRLAEAAEPVQTRLPLSLGERRRPIAEAPRGQSPALSRAYEFLLNKVVHRGFLVDVDGNIHHTFGDAGRYTPQSGSFQTNLLSLVDEPLKPAVHTTLLRAKRTDSAERSGFVEIEIGGVTERLRIETQAMPPDHHGRRMYLVFFTPEEPMPTNLQTQSTDEGGEEKSEGDVSGEVSWLRQELVIARQSLQNLMQEVGTRNEELQAANEELTATNEEMQSTNEELQSVNEELYTVNNEYQKKILELQATTDDLNNLIRSTEIGVIFTDSNLNIRRFTPKATEFLRLIDTDIGRSLKDISPKLQVSDLTSLATEIAAEGRVHEEEIKTDSGNWYLMRILPFRGKGKAVEGVILAFFDIHARKMVELAVRIAEERFDLATSSVGLGIWDWNLETDDLFWSDAFKKMVLTDETNFKGHIDDFKDRVHPDDIDRVTAAIEAHFKDETPYDIEFAMVGDNGSPVRMRVRGAAIRNDEGVPVRLVGSAEDISDLQRRERALRYEQTPLMMHSIDTEGRLIDVNSFWLRRMGYERNEVIGRQSSEFLTEKSRKRAVEQVLPKFFEAGECKNIPYQLITKSGDILDVLLSATLIKNKDGEPIVSLATLVDATELKESQLAQLDLLERIDDLPMAIAVYDVNDHLLRWNPAFEAFYAPIADRIVAGTTFAELHRATADADLFEEALTEKTLEARLKASRWSEERTLKDGTKARILDCRLVDGSLVTLRYKTLHSGKSLSDDSVETSKIKSKSSS